MGRDPTVFWALTGLDGRVDREVFWLGNLLTFFAAGILLVPSIDPSTGVMQLSAIAPVVLAAVFWAQIALSVKRLHDRGLTGWFSAIYAVPFVGILAFFVIGLMPGQPGPNSFGPAANARG